jgi:hypothetical protein
MPLRFLDGNNQDSSERQRQGSLEGRELGEGKMRGGSGVVDGSKHSASDPGCEQERRRGEFKWQPPSKKKSKNGVEASSTRTGRHPADGD